LAKAESPAASRCSPSSPRALTLLELRTALLEATTLKLSLGNEPALARLPELLGPSLDPETLHELSGLVGLMQSVESSVLRGRPARLTRGVVDGAARTVGRVLERIGFPTAGLPLASAEGGGLDPTPRGTLT
jgi:hypothetical protein